jgi:hypothetical protein
MKVSRCIALGLLIPLSVLAVLGVYLNAQDPVPLSRNPVPKLPDPEQPLYGPVGVGNNAQNQWSRVQYHSYGVTDPKTMQLITDEQAADQEARGLAASFAEATNDELRDNVKKKLKEKLAAIFEMQQKRRTAEIASIEERLAKLKDISKKRETNKDAIVDRRLEQLTGGVDDLGWEDINRGARYSTGAGGNVLEVPYPYRANVLTPDAVGPAPVPVEPRVRNNPLEKK